MFHRNRRLRSAVAGALGIGGVLGMSSLAAASEPSRDELLQKLEALQAKVEKLEAGQQATTQRLDADHVDATVASVLRDADDRSVFLQNVADLPAGYEKGKFFIRSTDGRFTLNPAFQFQLRYVLNYREGEGDDGDDDAEIESGFELRRMKFGFAGTAYEKFKYKFVWFTNRNGGEVLLEDAEVQYALTERLSIFGGQFKNPVHHEELVSSSKQLSADRSLVNELLGGGVEDRVQGVGVNWDNEVITVIAAVHDGRESLNTNFRDSPTNDSDYGAAARVEYLAFGDKKGYGDFTALGNTGSMLVFGAGVGFSGLEDTNGIAYTIDAQYETGPLALYAALLGQTTREHGDDDEVDEEGEEIADDADAYGGLVQAGYMLSDKLELFGRYGYISLDDDSLDEDQIHEITVGSNYYIEGHNVKVTADVIFLPSGSPGESGLGIIDSGDESQFVGRLQFQLLI